MSKAAERFRSVALERIERITQDLVRMESSGFEEDALRGVLRELHTLKGEAGVLALQSVASLTHALEGYLGAAAAGRLPRNAELYDTSLSALDALGVAVERGDEASRALTERAAAKLRELLERSADETAGPNRSPTSREESATERLEAVPAEAMAAPQREPQKRRMRVDPRRLSRLSELAGDLLVFRERGAERCERLERLQRELRASLPHSEWLVELEDLARELAQDHFLESQRVRALGEELRSLRLAPIEELLEGYRRAARDLARSLGKELRLELHAESVEVDQSVLDLLSEPLLHLVRNAIAHGLEGPDEREASGKDRAGTIRIDVLQVGAEVEIRVADDGRGIDPARVAQQAVAHGLLTPEQGEGLGRDEALEFIFRPGFSTSHLSELSGRGIGLDVVRRRVEEHQGTVQVSSLPGEGTQFLVRVPTDVAMARALVCTAAGDSYAIAVHLVERILSFDPQDLRPLGDGQGLRVDEETIPLCRLRSFVADDPEGTIPRGAPVLLIHSRRQRMALVPDEVVGQRDAAFRPLNPFLSELDAVLSSCVLSSGAVALLLEPTALLDAAPAWFSPRREARAEGKESAPRDRPVLVVEDSAVVRELLLEIVRNAGYRPIPAADGLEALEHYSRQRPSLILTDLEMPRVNGVELTRRVRASGDTPRVPVVVITTRASEEERRACLEAGADAFLDKSKFRESVLLDTIHRLLG